MNSDNLETASMSSGKFGQVLDTYYIDTYKSEENKLSESSN